jgi:predicted neuraminidase
MLLALLVVLPPALTWADTPATVKHGKVFHEKGRFGGWPANHGIWSWGKEILVGFSAGHYKDLGGERHAIDRDKPEEHLLARSLDGGETWSIENPARKGVLLGTAGGRHGTLPPGYKETAPIDCPGGIEFTHTDFAMTCRMTSNHAGVSRFYYSYDRGRSWKGPFKLPLFDQTGIAARTDYIINGKHDCMVLLTASKSNKREGRVICVHTQDGGKTWKLRSLIGPEPKGYAIMPSTARLSPSTLLTTIRVRLDGPKRKSWIEAWRSEDDGKSWKFLNEPVSDTGEGNPPHLLKLADGRLCLTYGVRAAPYRMAAKLSTDSGTTWSKEIVLRDDGGNRDLGYPRSVQRPDGKIVTVYYFWDSKSGPERYIAATIWTPPAASPTGTFKASVPVKRVFGPEDPGGRYKHPAAITQLANGDLYLAYYTGSGEYASDTAVFGARLPKGQSKWTTPVPIADTPYRSEGNPVVWQAPDGKVWLFYVVRYGKTWSTSLIQAKISKDGAKTWSDPMLVTMKQGMMVRGRPLALQGGDILLPAYHETGHDTEKVGSDSCSLFFRFDAEKHTWTETHRIRSRIGNIQPAVAQVKGDFLVCYCRRGGDYTGDPTGRIVRAESRDGGRTWSDGKDSEFKNPNAAVEFLRLRSGNLLLIYNDSIKSRTPLTAALSTDGDRSYPHRRHLIEGPGDFAYPYAIQSEDGTIHLIFTANRRTTIYHATFKESDILDRRK